MLGNSANRSTTPRFPRGQSKPSGHALYSNSPIGLRSFTIIGYRLNFGKRCRKRSMGIEPMNEARHQIAARCRQRPCSRGQENGVSHQCGPAPYGSRHRSGGNSPLGSIAQRHRLAGAADAKSPASFSGFISGRPQTRRAWGLVVKT